MALSESERNDFILECLSQGMSLSELQDQLLQQHDIHMTYMELRMLTADLQVNWTKQDAKAEAARPKLPPEATAPAQPGEGMPQEEDAEDAYVQEEMPAEATQPQQDAAPAEGNAIRGKTTVEISKVVRPGASLSGTVTFGSGASGEWYVDQYGRLGLSLAEGSAKPDQQDVQEFQLELQKQLGY